MLTKSLRRNSRGTCLAVRNRPNNRTSEIRQNELCHWYDFNFGRIDRVLTQAVEPQNDDDRVQRKGQNSYSTSR